MASLLDKYFKLRRSNKDVMDCLVEIKSLLLGLKPLVISASQLNKFLFSSDGIISLINVNEALNVVVISIIQLFIEKKIICLAECSIAKRNSLISQVLITLRDSSEKEIWINGSYIACCLEFCELFGTSTTLVSRFFLPLCQQIDLACESILRAHTRPTDNHEVQESAHNMFLSLWRSQTAFFGNHPSPTSLHSVVQILAFGILLAKLMPKLYLKELSNISVQLLGVATAFRSSNMFSNPSKLNIREIVDLSASKMVCMLADLMQNTPGPVLLILDQLVIIFPTIILESSLLQKVIEILMKAIRLPPSLPTNSSPDSDDKNDNEMNQMLKQQSTVLALNVFIHILDALHNLGSIFDSRSQILLQLFDLLRVFPTTLAHCEARLLAWWHFLCRLPCELVNDGFRKFVSPFLANLLGRYLSISSPQGDPMLHLYKLSQGNVYEGNRKALQLIQHVYGCFFEKSGVQFRFLEDSHVPRLTVSIQLLIQNTYPLLVGLFYWLRTICGWHKKSNFDCDLPHEYLPSQRVDEIWIGCIDYLLKLAEDFPENLMNLTSLALQSPSVCAQKTNSISSSIWQHVTTVTCQLLHSKDSTEYNSGICVCTPNPDECLNILEAMLNFVNKYTLSDKDVADVVFALILKSCELGGLWIKENILLESSAKCNLSHRWADLTIKLIEIEPRLNLSKEFKTNIVWKPSGSKEFLSLLRQLISTLLPDCTHLLFERLSPDFTVLDSESSFDCNNIPTVYFSPDGLRIWSHLVDHLTNFIMNNHEVTEFDPVVSPDLSTVQTTLLIPFWLAGSNRPTNIEDIEYGDETNAIRQQDYLSIKDELATSKRLFNLFKVFHQECCLLTTVPTNSWISQLCNQLSNLMSAFSSKVLQHVNISLIGRFILCLVQNAELVQEKSEQKSSLSPFTSRSNSHYDPLGQLKNLANLLNMCLLHIPWLNPPTQTEDGASPPRRLSTQKIVTRFLTSPPNALAASQSELINENCKSVEISTKLRDETSPTNCGLLDVLKAVVLLIKDHAREPQLAVCIFRSLQSGLIRLVQCCASAEEIVIKAGIDLDEPLLITQYRQQAQLLMEEIFISFWKQLKIIPPSFCITKPSSMILSISSDRSARQPIPDYIHDDSQRLLISALILCGFKIDLEKPFQSNTSSHPKFVNLNLSITFLTWLIGYWNSLVEYYYFSDSNANSKQVSDMKRFLSYWELEFHQFINHKLNPNLDLLISSSESKNSPKLITKSIQTPKSEPSRSHHQTDRRRGRPVRLKPPNQSQSASVSPLKNFYKKQIKIENGNSVIDDNANSIHIETDQVKHEPVNKKSIKPEPLESNSNQFVGSVNSTELPSRISPSSTHRSTARSHRGRLSLNKIITGERVVTPVRRSIGSSTNLTRSEPSNSINSRRSKRHGVNLFPSSPTSSPANGIIATAFGIQPGSSLMVSETHWSPSSTSPGPLPARPLVKRRLFSGPQESPQQNANSSVSQYKLLDVQPRKRHFSDSEPDQNAKNSKSVSSPLPSVPFDGDDSAQFVFIAPQAENPKKRRRNLTLHQKERFMEQKHEYIPTMYTELDLSQQSSISSDSLSGSQSQSQFSQVSLMVQPEICQPDQINDENNKCALSTIKNPSNLHKEEIEKITTAPTDSGCSHEITINLLASESPSVDLKNHVENCESTNCEVESGSNVEALITSSDSCDLSNHVDENQPCSSTLRCDSNLVLSDLPNQNNNNNNITKTPDQEIGSPSSSLSSVNISVPSILTSRSMSPNLTSPLIRGSSRAQKMLVLGLQKAAELNSRQKVHSSSDQRSNSDISNSNSGGHSPNTAERKQNHHYYTPTTNSNNNKIQLNSPSCYTINQAETDSPTGIMRSLWSRKKTQRVSFAEQPVIYTFGSTNTSNQSDDSLSPDNLSERTVLSDLTNNYNYTDNNDKNNRDDVSNSLYITTFKDDMDTDCSTTNSSILKEDALDKQSEVCEIRKSASETHIQLNSIIVNNSSMSVDLDASQSSQSVIPDSEDPANPTIFIGSHLSPASSQSYTHRRKSTSPQRLVVTKKQNTGSRRSTNVGIKPSQLLLAHPKGRPLFSDDLELGTNLKNMDTNVIETLLSPIEKPATNNNNNYTIFSSTTATVSDNNNNLLINTIVADSEPTEIADTQQDEINPFLTEPIVKPFSLVEEIQTNQNDENTECSVIESSQSSQLTCSSNNDDHDNVHNSISFATKSTTTQSISNSLSSVDQIIDELTEQMQPSDSIHMEDINVTPSDLNKLPSPEQSKSNLNDLIILNNKDISSMESNDRSHHNSDQNVEEDIINKLSQISEKLPILHPDQHKTVLLKVLSTFKSIMP